jgi:hypothetical protein
MAKFTAGDTGTETVVADTNSVVLELIGKVVAALGHGSDKDADALLAVERFNIVPDANDGGVETERDLAAVGRQMVGDGVLDHLEQLFLRVGRANRQTMEQLHHQASKSLECSRNAHCRADFNQDAFRGVDVDLQTTSLIDRRIEKGEKTL